MSPSDPYPIRSDAVKHVVQQGDTLYSIAWRYGYDYHQLAARNRIFAPYTIYPGQVIYLRSAPIASGENPTNESTESDQTDSYGTAAESDFAQTKRSWPVNGPVLSGFDDNGLGLDIGGRYGETVYSIAAGTVVYAGTGLRQFGRLVIVKHDALYLSAYGHNADLMVKEGDQVAERQAIAKMGRNDDGVTVLHFEIRKNGRSVDPARYLVKAK